MIVLKDYSVEAVTKLVDKSKALMQREDVPEKTIVFQSPTGSGKTLMMAKYIEELCNKVYPDEPIAFIWVSVAKGELHVQSKRALERYFDGYPAVSLYENEYTSGKERLDDHAVTVVNWEKLRAKDRSTKEWKNKLMKSAGDFFNFQEVLDNTRRDCKIFLIIDESHLGMDAERTVELRQIIGADITIEVSATPKMKLSAEDLLDGRGDMVRVDSKRVIDEGMIKKEIVINEGVGKFDDQDDETTSESIVLEAAYRKRLELAQYYREAGAPHIRPLVLIQLPNSEAGLAKRESVEKWLAEKKITVENKQLAIWLSEDKSEAVEGIEKTTSPVEFLLFKQAIDTGWDCPRAAILVKFRETHSVVFEIQTVGRILRMPEQKHYEQEALNRGYVYTNIAQILVKKEEYNPNIIQTIWATKRDGLENITLRSFYRKRTDLGVITSSFYPVFNRVFSNYFGMEEDGVQNTVTNQEKMRAKGVDIDLRRNIINISGEGVIATKVLDTLGVGTASEILTEKLRTRQADNDTQAEFVRHLIPILNGYAVRDSIKTLRKAIYDWFEYYLGIKLYGTGIVHVQNIVLRPTNWDKLQAAIAATIEAYKPVREFEIKTKNEEIEYDWNIGENQSYNEHLVIKEKKPLHFLQSCYLYANRSNIEKEFEDYLEKQEDKIKWWYKNGVSNKAYFGIRYTKDSGVHTFYPDYIVQFYDGLLGIFDTKAGMTAADAKERAEALQAYIRTWNEAGMNLVGGIVVKSKQGVLKVNRQEEYRFSREDLGEWEFWGRIF